MGGFLSKMKLSSNTKQRPVLELCLFHETGTGKNNSLYFCAYLFNQGSVLSLFQPCSLSVHIFIYKNKYLNSFNLVLKPVEAAQKEFEGGRRLRKEVQFSSAVL